ncbi:HNH endonuclease [Buttiauxella gaviniae]|uniref:HNH endonuclease n=1 Tax=Buttiauxella gaviniae TaxID=82990 RepID=UPI0039AFC8D3
MLTHKKLTELLHYDAETGKFTHIKKRRGVKLGSIAGSVMPVGYIYIAVDGKRYYAHRLAYFFMEKEWPDEVDHINGIKSDNRWCNLRNASRQENSVNTGIYSSNTSGYRGVVKTSVGTWRVEVQRNGKYHYLGCFKTKEEASRIRNEFVSKLDGEFFNKNIRKSELEGVAA